jgi:uncharacterized protein YjbI with pentapeptide repeats
MPWSPTIRAALLAGTPWLDVFCPGKKSKTKLLLATKTNFSGARLSQARVSGADITLR